MARFTAFPSDSEDDSSSSSSSSSSSGSLPRQVPILKKKPKRDHPSFSARTPTPSSSTSSESVQNNDDSSDDDDDDSSSSDSIMDEDELEKALPREEEEEPVIQPRPWAQQLDLEPKRVHVMQASLFRAAEQKTAPVKDKFGFVRQRRSSDAIQDSAAKPEVAPNRASFAQLRSQPPPRKYVRVTAPASASAGHEDAYVDTGLKLGRSSRVGWGPGDKIACIRGVKKASASTSNPLSVTIVSPKRPTAEPVDLLQHLLDNTQITAGSDAEAPFALPRKELTFSSFSSLFGSQDRTHTASVFRLSHALFDPLDLHLGASVPPSIRARVLSLRRADALSSWLTRAVAASVDQDIRAAASADPASVAFSLLSGHQIEKAVDTLIDGGDIRLATLVSQLPGDLEFRADVQEQLQIWKDEKVDAHMSQSIRKLYALAAGEVEFLEGSSRKENINVAKGLDWLRLFGLQLWYASLLDTPLNETFDVFEQTINELTETVSYPRPWYSKELTKKSEIKDGLYNLLKLAMSPSMSLESTLTPLSFSSDPCDYKLPWLLYIILSRCLRLRDFTDRQLYDAMDSESGTVQDLESYSQTANAMTVQFSLQLQQQGLTQEAAFVLLFLDDAEGRKRAIKELLARSAPLLDNWTEAGLLGSLKLPQEWVDEAKASHAFYMGEVYLAYELFMRAKVHQRAHDLAISYLAPEAILRDDLTLLTNLFAPLDKSLIRDFNIGGQLFIDYAHLVNRIPELRAKLEAEEDNAVPDAAQTSELELLNGKVPKLIGILPDAFQGHDRMGTGLVTGSEEGTAALSHMLSRLLACVNPETPTKIDLQPGLVDAGARLKHIHSSAYASFMRTIAALA